MSAPILIATAGHVDHGKSTMVQALTGIDPDRWAAEKERGITIDLGYAHVSHAGRNYSFIDVPGHERFIHNMLAGIGSIDAVLFVIAADESIMPQTREHALALRYLGIEQVHVVITKVDLVSDDLLELLDMEVEEFLEENGWPDAEKVSFSSKQPETTANVLGLLESLNKKDPGGRTGFRLSIDRVFTSQGSGTVLTGTVDRGALESEQSISIQPHGLEGRIKQMQLHGETVDRVGPHTRVALNLGGVHYKQVHRGNCVFSGAEPVQARKILVRFHAFEEDWAPTARHEFHLHHLAARLIARMLWRREDIAALELRDPYGFWALDRGLIRDGSPMTICAGFEVLDPDLRRPKRRQVLPFLTNLPQAGDLTGWQSWFLGHCKGLITEADLIARCGEPLLPELRQSLVSLDERHMVHEETWRQSRENLVQGLKTCHRELPIFDTIPLTRVLSFFRDNQWPEPLLEACMTDARETQRIEIQEDRVRLTDHKPVWKPADKDLLKRFLAQLDDGLAVIDLKLIKEERDRFAQIEKLLVWDKFLVNLSSDLLIHHAFLSRIARTLAERFSQNPFSIPELKEAFGFTRKYAIPLLEYLDKLGYTRREGDKRVWIAREIPEFVCSRKPPRFD
ncbi:MAG: selenocysteine-specific translation elongation factor [Acidobacteriota bacterium]|nr:selenocysteine-specific translation elongation factor [Acidobacteriota bacterium]